MIGKTRSRKRIRWAIALAGIALIALVAGVLRFHLFVRVPETARPRIVRIASYPGMQLFDTRFSLDGNRIAFGCYEDKDYNTDIYVKQIGAEKTLRLTSDPATDESPAWSPDGRNVAFRRRGDGKDGIYVVPAMGGPERKLLTSGSSHFGDSSLDWSPDGKYLAYIDRGPSQSEEVFLLAVDNPMDKRPLTAPVGQWDYFPRFSPDGRSVAFVRFLDVRDIFLVRTAGGEPKRITFDDTFIYGLDWSPDGAYIVFLSDRLGGTVHLWKVLASGGQPEPLPMPSGAIEELSLSRHGRRLAYTQQEFNSNIWRYEVPRTTGQSAPPTKLIASEGYNGSPQFSPDGKRVAFVSSRSGSWQAWVCNRDGSNPRQLTFLDPIGTRLPRWSPDSREIAFQVPTTNEGTNIYVVGGEGGQPRRLDTGRSRVAAPSWSRDGKWIYFGSNRSGTWQVWRIPVHGGHAVQVTKKGGAGGLESPDGKTLYYAKGLKVRGLWKIPVQGGEETQVLHQPWAGLFEAWGLAREGIYFYNDETSAVEFFSFATHQVTQILKPEKRGGDVALSPDGQWILFGQVDVDTSHIMLVENFQ